MNTGILRIFIVDDDRIMTSLIRNEIRNILGPREIEIIIFENGEYCEPFINTKPDIAIIDYHLNSRLPQAGNGIQVIDLFKKGSPDTDLILFTADDNLEIAVEAFEHGANDYVVKNQFMFWRLNVALKQCVQHFDLRSRLLLKKKIINSILFTLLFLLISFATLQWYFHEF